MPGIGSDRPIQEPVEEEFPNPGYAWYVVVVLAFAYIVSFIDRQILNLLVEPIQQDLQLSDTQISLLQGLAFALFYTIVGLPIARLADVANRRSIIAAGVFLWSLMTAACGLANSFIQLFCARVGVGVGEAALSPSAYSLIGDYFPASKVTRAIAVYTAGSMIGAGLAYVIGGIVVGQLMALKPVYLPFIGEVRNWQLAFIAVGLPGLLLAGLILTIREPLRKGIVQKDTDTVSKSIPIKKILGYLRTHWRTYSGHIIGVSFLLIVIYGFLAWIPTFFIRVHGWTAGQIGIAYGAILLSFGTCGVASAGWFADALRRRGYTDANLRVILIGVVCMIPIGTIFPLVESPVAAMILLVPLTFLFSLPHGIAPAALLPITPNQMRAQVSALYMFSINIIGLGLGPTTVALMTDYVFKTPEQVGNSLACLIVIIGPIAALIIGIGLRHYRKTLVEAEKGWHTFMMEARE